MDDANRGNFYFLNTETGEVLFLSELAETSTPNEKFVFFKQDTQTSHGIISSHKRGHEPFYQKNNNQHWI